MADRFGAVAPRGSGTGGGAAGLAPRLALFVVTAVFAGFVVNAVQYVVAEETTFTHVAPAVLSLAVMMVLQLGFFSNPAADVRGWRGRAALLVQAVVVFGPIALYGEGWTGMQGFLAGDALLVLRLVTGWLVFAAVAVTNGIIQYRLTEVPLETAYITVLTAVVGLVVYGLSRLRSLVKELDDARSELAGLAVARERLRFARDLHDLLGFSLSAITLKAELTHRLITRMPERAGGELDEILDISRQALADVRAVASSYRELSLDDELASSCSVLTAADVVVTTKRDQVDLPARTRTVLATVLREGVTNLLRHSKAERCDITVTGDGRTVQLEIVNDGVRETGEPVGHGSGIGNLESRVEGLGGVLTAGPGPDGTYRLHAAIPLHPDDDATAGADPRDGHPDHGQAMAPRLGQVIATAVFCGYAVNATVLVVATQAGVSGKVVSEACVLVSLLLVLGFFSRPTSDLRSPLGYSLLVVLAVVTYLPVLVFDNPFLGLPGLFAGSLLLTLPARFGPAAFLVVMASMAGAQHLTGGDSIDVTYGVLVTINHGLVVFALSRLRTMVRDLHGARSELADLAVTRERLRFARDLHDLLGFSLSAITLKSELTHRLMARDPARAQRELSGIIDISRQALADVRAVASSYRELSLDEETSAARALLAAANINVTVELEPCELAPDVRTALATVVREGVTNLLRHSHAENCEITLTTKGDRLTMEIVNDGVAREDGPRGARVGGDGGSGIANLKARVSGVGGTLHAGTTCHNTYRLLVEIPLPRS